VNQARTQFLAGPALALDQHRHVGLGDHLQLAPDEPHLLGSTEKDFHRREVDLGFVLREPYSSHIFLSPMARDVSRSRAINPPGNVS
jgi:hypothetical protein